MIWFALDTLKEGFAGERGAQRVPVGWEALARARGQRWIGAKLQRFADPNIHRATITRIDR